MKYNRLTIIKEYFKQAASGQNQTYCECVCDCGKKSNVRKSSLINGSIKSCGCYNKEQSALNKSNTKHGLYHTELYKKYYNMKARCYNLNSAKYP